VDNSGMFDYSRDGGAGGEQGDACRPPIDGVFDGARH
jgi:hypothetical protein